MSTSEAVRTGQGTLNVATRHDAVRLFQAVRAETERRAAPLSHEDQCIQSMPDASPTKWHRAHTTWFFEEFLLQRFAPAHRVFDPHFRFLFNSYYETVGPRHARPDRGLITRPSVDEVAQYRAFVDAAVVWLCESSDEATFAQLAPILEIGLHHEQQHQELLMTDILHAFSRNPLHPKYSQDTPPQVTHSAVGTAALPDGVHTVGLDGAGFAFDNESPAHQTLILPGAIDRQLTTNAQWLQFMADGGYTNPALWLSEGWARQQHDQWVAPGYWFQRDGQWFSQTLSGAQPIDPTSPVVHVSYYEADAFARWAGRHLPTELDWEVAVRHGLLADAFDVAWQWTRSAYLPYPGYRAAEGALGEYNGKFMVNQMVLRGSSCVTPPGHARTSYRNFFHPAARWQFSGVRLMDYT